MRHSPFVKRLNHYPDIQETYVVIAVKLMETCYLKMQKLCRRTLQNHGQKKKNLQACTFFSAVIFRWEKVNLSFCIALAFNWYYKSQNIFILLKIKERLEGILRFFFSSHSFFFFFFPHNTMFLSQFIQLQWDKRNWQVENIVQRQHVACREEIQSITRRGRQLTTF